MFASGRIVDLIVLLMGAEALLLHAMQRWGGRRALLSEVGWTLASGVCLLLALRAALAEAAWTWIAACLGAALIAHLLDLARRLR